MNEICSKLPIPIIFHHDDINNSRGLNLDTLAKILANKKIVALKEHSKSLKSRNKIYKKFGKKLIFYGGFSKADFISSYIHGARAKHSNFSWFEPKWDRLFMKCLKDKRYKLAKKMCDIENNIKNLKDPFKRNLRLARVEIDSSFPKYLRDNINIYNDWILK